MATWILLRAPRIFRIAGVPVFIDDREFVLNGDGGRPLVLLAYGACSDPLTDVTSLVPIWNRAGSACYSNRRAWPTRSVPSPSFALATLGLTVATQGKLYAAVKTRSICQGTLLSCLSSQERSFSTASRGGLDA